MRLHVQGKVTSAQSRRHFFDFRLRRPALCSLSNTSLKCWMSSSNKKLDAIKISSRYTTFLYFSLVLQNVMSHCAYSYTIFDNTANMFVSYPINFLMTLHCNMFTKQQPVWQWIPCTMNTQIEKFMNNECTDTIESHYGTYPHILELSRRNLTAYRSLHVCIKRLLLM